MRPAGAAGQNLSDVSADNVAVIEGALEAGCPEQAPFDRDHHRRRRAGNPAALKDQLKDGGRLVCVLGQRACRQGAYRRAVRQRGKCPRRVQRRGGAGAGLRKAPGFLLLSTDLADPCLNRQGEHRNVAAWAKICPGACIGRVSSMRYLPVRT